MSLHHVLSLLKALRVSIPIHAVASIRVHAVASIRIHAIASIRIHAIASIRIIILKSINAHAPHDLVGEVPYHGEQNRVYGQNCILAATFGQSYQNAGC